MSERGTSSRDYNSPGEYGPEENRPEEYGPSSQDHSHGYYRSDEHEWSESQYDYAQEHDSDLHWQESHAARQSTEREYRSADYYRDQGEHSVYEDRHLADSDSNRYPGDHYTSQYDYSLPDDDTDPHYFAPGRDVEDRGLYRAAEIQKAENRIRFNDADFMDVNRPKFSNMGTTLSGFAGVVAMLGLIGFLAFSSKPELSPTDIVSMQGYSGEQKTTTAFNLAELRGCETLHDCDESTSATQLSENTAAVASSNQAGSTQNGLNQEGSEQASGEHQTYALNKIPVVTGHTSTQQGASELVEVPATTNQYVNVSESGYSSNDEAEQLQVSRQWSNVRDAPSMAGAIIKALPEGTDVTVLSKTGNWFEIQVNNPSQITGYMHKNTVSEL